MENACQTVSAAARMLASSIRLHPNPTAGLLYLDLPGSMHCTAQVRNALGQVVIPEHHLKSDHIDLSGLRSGLYLVELANDQQRFVKKVMWSDDNPPRPNK